MPLPEWMYSTLLAERETVVNAQEAASAKLTTAILRSLVGEVANGTSPASAAAQWLSSTGLG